MLLPKAVENRQLRVLLFSCILADIGLSVMAADWPCYRGPDHDGHSSETLLSPFPAVGPQLLWKKSIEPAFSSFAVSGGKAFSQARRSIEGQSREVCVALDANTGSELWATPVGIADYPDGQAGSDDGPRTTPTVDSGSVFVLSSHLLLTRLTAEDGQVIWQKDLRALYGGEIISWQNAASPLIDGEYIYVNCGNPTNSFLALRKSDGSLVWKTGAEAMTHATPVVTTIEGTRQVIFLTALGLTSLDASSGALLWHFEFPANSTSTAASPVVSGSIVFCSAAYGTGGVAVQISRLGPDFTVTELWRNTLQNHWSTPVCHEGYLYGLFGYYSSASLRCIDLLTGAEMWSEPGFGSGGVLFADGKLLVNDIRGNLVLVEAYSRAYYEAARFTAVQGKCWNSAALSNGRLFTRSTTEAACYMVGPAVSPPRLLLSLERKEGNLLLRAVTDDGTPLTPDRLSSLRVLYSTNLSNPYASWSDLPVTMLIANGAAEATVEESGETRFLILSEP